MAKMFVANCTNQIQDFAYRVVEGQKLLRQQIPIGGQIQLSGDLSVPDIAYIIRQHAHYGLVDVTEIDRTREFTGLVFSLDKPVNMNRVLGAVERNFAVLDERGRQLRQEAAVALNNQLENGTSNLKSLEVTIQEEDRKNGESGTFSEGVRVDRRAAPPGPGSKRTGSAGKPRARRAGR